MDFRYGFTEAVQEMLGKEGGESHGAGPQYGDVHGGGGTGSGSGPGYVPVRRVSIGGDSSAPRASTDPSRGLQSPVSHSSPPKASQSESHGSSVFDRLSDPSSYTGVYAKRFELGPAINGADQPDRLPPGQAFPVATHLYNKLATVSSAYTAKPPTIPVHSTIRDPAGGFGTPPIHHPPHHTGHLNRGRSKSPSRATHRRGSSGGSVGRSVSPSRHSVTSGGSSVFQGDASTIAPSYDPGFVEGLPYWATHEAPKDRARRHAVLNRRPAALASILSSTNDQKLRLIFCYYCAYGLTGAKKASQDSIDCSNFAKFTRECPGLLDSYHRIACGPGSLNPTDVDMVFVMCKDRLGRRLDYGQFLTALDRLAQLKYPDDAADTAFGKLLTNHVFTCDGARCIEETEMQMYQSQVAAMHASAAGMTTMQQPPYASTAMGSSRSPPSSPPSQHAPPQYSTNSYLESKPQAVGHGYGVGAGVPASPAVPAAVPSVAPAPYPVAYFCHGCQYCSGNMFHPRVEDVAGSGGGGAGASAGAGQYASYPPPPVPSTPSLPSPGAYYPAPSSRLSATLSPGSVSRTGGADGGPLPVQYSVDRAGTEGLHTSPYSNAARMHGVPAGASVIGSEASTMTSISRRMNAAEARRTHRITKYHEPPPMRRTFAGEANRPGGVYDRLSSPANFTGVYRRAWMTDGRMNHYVDTMVSNIPSAYEGDTNTGTDEIISDVSVLLRPNLKYGKNMKI